MTRDPRSRGPTSPTLGGSESRPAESAPAFVLRASDDASYIAGATIAVTGGRPPT